MWVHIYLFLEQRAFFYSHQRLKSDWHCSVKLLEPIDRCSMDLRCPNHRWNHTPTLVDRNYMVCMPCIALCWILDKLIKPAPQIWVFKDIIPISQDWYIMCTTQKKMIWDSLIITNFCKLPLLCIYKCSMFLSDDKCLYRIVNLAHISLKNKD